MQSGVSHQHLTALAPPLGPWRLTGAGLCASLVGIGMARFAYTPLLPAIIGAHWFSAAAAAYLGAANLGGYLAGALLGAPMASRVRAASVLRAMMLLATVAFFACALPVSFLWFFGWRFASGIAGGALMVLAAPTVLPHIPAARRGLASGAIFMGVGLGIAASGSLVPILLSIGLMQTWLGLGALSLFLTLVAWHGWPTDHASGVPTPRSTRRHALPVIGLRALYVEYALNAVALVPHMIFLVDFIVRGLHRGLGAASAYWVLFGLGAIVGPLLSGHLADRTGFKPALRVAYLIEGLAVAMPAFAAGPGWLMVSSVVVGAFTPGIVPLVLGRVNELLVHHPASQKSAWSMATTSFAVLQAGAAYGMSFLFVRGGGDYRRLFIIGAVAMALALTLDLLVAPAGEGDAAGADRKNLPE